MCPLKYASSNSESNTTLLIDSLKVLYYAFLSSRAFKYAVLTLPSREHFLITVLLDDRCAAAETHRVSARSPFEPIG